MYSAQELQEIQDMLAGKKKLSDQEIDSINNEFTGKQLPNYLCPFVGLFATNPDLYRKISEDERVKEYSMFGFFPETFDLVYGSETSPEMSLRSGNRGIVGIIQHPTKNVVIKALQNMREYEVAKIADEEDVGPKQYKTLERFLTEQFVEGELFSGLREDRRTSEHMYRLGLRVGEILKRLHLREVYYNDTILTDDFGRSHLIVPETSPAILIDYGVALRLNNHPNFSDEEVFNFARTYPFVNMSVEGIIHQYGKITKEFFDRVVGEFRPKIQILTKEQIMSRDIDFINEGLSFATFSLLGNHIVEPFSRGFNETYSRY